MDTYFAADYAEARAKFLESAKAVDVPKWKFDHPLTGPSGELSVPISFGLGPKMPEMSLSPALQHTASRGSAARAVRPGF